jgi:hypothetical protein
MKIKLPNLKGSILIEGCITLVLLLFVLIIQMETIRRIWVGAAAQSAAFTSVRAAVLGGHRYLNKMKIANLMASALPANRGNNYSVKLSNDHWDVKGNQRMLSKYHIKYPALIRFREAGLSKLNFEVTEQCHFPFLFRY